MGALFIVFINPKVGAYSYDKHVFDRTSHLICASESLAVSDAPKSHKNTFRVCFQKSVAVAASRIATKMLE